MSDDQAVPVDVPGKGDNSEKPEPDSAGTETKNEEKDVSSALQPENLAENENTDKLEADSSETEEIKKSGENGSLLHVEGESKRDGTETSEADSSETVSEKKEQAVVAPVETSDESKDEKKEEVASKSDSSNPEIDRSNLHYEGEVCYYTDPSSKQQYTWDEPKREWVPRADQPSVEDYVYDGSSYTYVDKKTNVKYKWDTEKNSWVTDEQPDKPKEMDENNDNEFGKVEANYGFENDTHTYTDPKDNTVYIWDREKSAWFPRVDDDFLAQYQMNYGFVDPNAEDKEPEKPSEAPKDAKAEKRKATPQEPTWFEVDNESNTKVYVSNLPLDITETEFVDVMQKCGLVMRDVDSAKMKIKLYTKPGSKQLKGDGLCTYIKKESVELALSVLDGYNLRDHRLHIERAKFTMKGEAYDPSLKPKKKKKKEIEKIKKMQEKLFDWRPDKLRGERPRNESVVILKNLFAPEMFDKDVKLILEIQQDLREECQKCGAIRRIIVHDRHPEGVAQVNFKEVEAADACIQLMHGRWFSQRKITAEAWDGKTKYKIVETEEQIKKRIEKWDKYLDNEEEKIDGAKKKSDEKTKSKNNSNIKETKMEEEEEEEEDDDDDDDDAEKVKKEAEQEGKTIENDSDEDTKSSGNWSSTDDEDDSDKKEKIKSKT